MAVQFDTPPGRPARRTQQTDLIIIAAAAVLAVAAALAAQMGVPQAQPLVGAIVILGIAYACSTDRRAIDVRTVAWGLSLQIVFALIVLKTTIGQRVFDARRGHQQAARLCRRRRGVRLRSARRQQRVGPRDDRRSGPKARATA